MKRIGPMAFPDALMKLFADLTPRYIGRSHDKRNDKIKSDGTPVGNLDLYAMEKIRELIFEYFPGEVTIGEEDKKSAEQMRKLLSDKDGCQWTIDGLDGTGNRGMGTNSFGAMISRRQGEKILLAALYRPTDERLRGNGFFYAESNHMRARLWCGLCNGYHSLRTAQHGELERITVMLEGSSKKFFKPPLSTLGLEITTRCSFSSCIAATTVAMGKASALVTVENKPWDNWPSACLIKEAGGIVTDWQGNPFDPANCGNMIAAANPGDHAVILEILNRKI